MEPAIAVCANQAFDPARVVRGLWLIFWGTLVIVLDFSINGFDLLNDVIGYVLVLIGVLRLAGQDGGPGYAGRMKFVTPMAILALVLSVLRQLPLPPEVFGMVAWLSLPILVGTIVFFDAIRQMSGHRGLMRSRASWSVTLLLFLAVYVAPLALFWAVIGLMLLLRRSFFLNLPPVLIIPTLIAALVPIVHLFISIRRMQREIAAPACGGFEVVPVPSPIEPPPGPEEESPA